MVLLGYFSKPNGVYIGSKLLAYFALTLIIYTVTVCAVAIESS